MTDYCACTQLKDAVRRQLTADVYRVGSQAQLCPAGMVECLADIVMTMAIEHDEVDAFVDRVRNHLLKGQEVIDEFHNVMAC